MEKNANNYSKSVRLVIRNNCVVIEKIVIRNNCVVIEKILRSRFNVTTI